MVMCEYMACGRTVIASDATGHADVINDSNAFALTSYTPLVVSDASGQPTAVWHEPSVDELIEQLEHAYRNKDLCRQKSTVAADDMTALSWDKSARRFHSIMLNL